MVEHRRVHRMAARVGALALLGLLPRLAWADPRDEARRHFTAGMELVRQGDYETGVREFLLAYEISPHPSVLYNVARAWADAREYTLALDYFELYLASDPPDRVEVEGMMQALRMRMEAAQVAAARAEVEPAPIAATGGVTSDELDILTRHAQELAALVDALQQRSASAEAAGTTDGQASPTTATDTAANEGATGTSQTDEAPPLELGEEGLVEDLYARVVVTASRYSQDPLHAPSAITVITEEDIRMSSAASIADLLRQVPGIDVMQLAAGQSEVSIRGFNRRLSNKVLVLVDGRSVYLDFIGSTLWNALPVTLEDIERIEIIRGTGSAIYGANAFAGVVNIITRNPGEHGVANQVTVAGGDHAFGRGSAVLNGRKADLGYRASVGTTRLGRWAQELDLTNRPDYTSPVEDQDTSLDMQTANAQFDLRLPKKGFASLSGGLAQGMDEFYAIGSLGNFYADLSSSYLRGDVGQGPWHLRAFWNRFRSDTGNWYYRTDGADISGDVLSDVYDIELRGDWTLGAEDQHRLSAAMGYRRKEIAWNWLNSEQREDHISGYVQDESRFGPVSVTASVRVDDHPLVGVTPSPRLAVVTDVTEGRAVRIGGGTAFRTPTFMESYLALDQGLETDGIYIRTVGDTTLQPENILAIEAAWLDHASDWWRGEATAYYARVTNLINLGDINSSLKTDGYDASLGGYRAGITSFVNEDTVYNAMGGELAWEYFGIDGLDVSLNYAFEFIQANDDGVATRDEATPMHKVNAGVIYRSPWRVDASMHANWVDRQVWPIRDFDNSTGQVVIDYRTLDGWVLLSNRLVLHPFNDQRLDLAFDAWNWLAMLPSIGAHREHPLGQPVDYRLFGSLTTRF